MQIYLTQKSTAALPLHAVTARGYKTWLAAQNAVTKKWLESTHFKTTTGAFTVIPDAKGAVALAVSIVDAEPDIWSLAHLAEKLPPLTYKLEGTFTNAQTERMTLGWALATYRFKRYLKSESTFATLQLPKGVRQERVQAMAESFFLARDLINTPTNDMLPSDLARTASQLAKTHKAKIAVTTGKELLSANYPMIYTVGKASADAPRLIDLRWGKTSAPKVTLIGKGVCFDSGGLDIKPSSNMRMMKKDMAGGAVVLALARAVIASKLNVNLRVLLPAVENAISGNAMRPLDVVKTRKGITVEIGNTDAEGRLILCDALTEADSEKPDLIIDCATLTGAARTALGPDMPAFFTPDDALAEALARHAAAENDPLYRLPLWKPYRSMLKSPTADISNDPEGPYAGAIAAALYLQEFVEHTQRWIHIDMMAWNLTSRPGRPQGGEAQGMRALFALLEERYG